MRASSSGESPVRRPVLPATLRPMQMADLFQMRSPATRLLPALAVGLLIAFVGLYTSALHEPRPHDLRVALVGSPALARQLQQRLDAAVPGGFDIDRYESAGAARDAVLGQEVQGALIVRGARSELLVAEAAGPTTSETLQSAFGSPALQSARAPRVEDLRPLPDHDSRGLSTFFTVVGTTLASLLFGAAPRRHRHVCGARRPHRGLHRRHPGGRPVGVVLGPRRPGGPAGDSGGVAHRGA